jgi:hypothetical protein
MKMSKGKGGSWLHSFSFWIMLATLKNEIQWSFDFLCEPDPLRDAFVANRLVLLVAMTSYTSMSKNRVLGLHILAQNR